MPFRSSHRSFARSCVAEVWTVMLLRVDRRRPRRGFGERWATKSDETAVSSCGG